MSDFTQTLAETVREAAASGDPLCIQGGNTKKFLGREPVGKPCSMSGYAGVTNYEPTELVITAKAGTTLMAIEATLAEAGQMLPFEPPGFGVDATIGGTIACGLSGPARPYRGAARDLVLG
ncbi:MAG: FAD-binding protein, partial [Pseudomonadota bacterium]